MGAHSSLDPTVDDPQTRRERRTVVTDGHRRVVVTCPHRGCERTATATVPSAESDLQVTRRSSYLGEYEEVRCPEGHGVFVHYCSTG